MLSSLENVSSLLILRPFKVTTRLVMSTVKPALSSQHWKGQTVAALNRCLLNKDVNK